MAIYKRDIVDINLETGNIHRSFLNHSIGTQDSGADHFGIRTFRDGEPVSLDGVSVQGIFMPPQGSPIAITTGNIVDGNTAEVVLPQACYNYEGKFTLAIKLVGGGVTGTIRIVDGMVDNTHASGTVAPTETVPTYQEVLSVFAQMEETLEEYEGVVATQNQQISDLKSALSDISDDTNLFDASTISANTRLSSSGMEITPADDVFTSDYIPVVSGCQYRKNSPYLNVYHRACIYDALKTFIVAIDNSNDIIVPQGGAYVRFCGADAELSTTDMHLVSARDDMARKSINALELYVVPYNCHDLLIENLAVNGTNKGVTYTFTGNQCRVQGTSTDISFRNIYFDTEHLPNGMTAGSDYYIKYVTSDTNTRLTFYFYKQDGTTHSPMVYTADGVLTVPSDAKGVNVRLDVPSGKTVDTTVTYAVLPCLTDQELTESYKKIGYAKSVSKYVNGNSLTLSDIVEDGFYGIDTSLTITDAPVGAVVTAMTVEHFSIYNKNGFVKQTVENIVSPSTSKHHYRVSNYNGSSWSEWVEITGGGDITNEYTFNEYSNTYNVNATPTITADTNNFLAATGDTTDVTQSIMTMLTQHRVCRLGVGDFYVTGIDLPYNGALIGSGSKTRIILSGTSDGYAIKMGNYSLVKDLSIWGSPSGNTISSPVRGRHGILWQGTYTANRVSDDQPIMGIVSDVWIRNFAGGAITCYDTGYGTFNHLECNNVFIRDCDAGVNIPYWSEFHKFTNIRAYGCYYGCINNGGNNVFSNCDFSKNIVGLLMDNGQGQSPNDSHGAFSNCEFVHCGTNNNGVGIHIIGCANSEIFTGCIIGGGSSVIIDDSYGIVFNACLILQNTGGIEISGGGLVLFNGCSFGSSLTNISIQNNNATRFVGCYLTDGTQVNPTV